MIAILDYGSGNLRSVERALSQTGAEVIVTSDFESCLNADGLVVPGVGAFGSCINGLRQVRGGEIVQIRFERQLPTLGICVGLQILFSTSSENPEASGIGILEGRVERLPARIIPHMGWNLVDSHPDSTLFQGVEDERFYFVHSYAVMQSENLESRSLTSWSEYGAKFLAAIEYGSLSATQFHPEKSGSAGLKFLSNWTRTLAA